MKRSDLLSSEFMAMAGFIFNGESYGIYQQEKLAHDSHYGVVTVVQLSYAIGSDSHCNNHHLQAFSLLIKDSRFSMSKPF